MNTKLILQFLKTLQKNNNREWFHANKGKFEVAKTEFEIITATLIQGISKFDKVLTGVEPKQCIYRIYRDVRFGKDKTPYKTHVGALLADEGRKTSKAFYYIHLEPGGKTIVGGGLYMPQGEVIKKIRQEIDYNSAEFKKIINNKKFKTQFGELQGEKLKRAPKGYSPEDPNIELLKLKSYLAVHTFTDKEVTADNFIKDCISMYKTMKPLNDFLNVAVS